ncbi:protein kinase family protein [Streptomyces antimycoticus]|uniref:hypothetical protein n=1 Tax=Streptomyces antimycoticus TaxID=68175 RepID=UPI00368FED6A
MLKLLLEPAHGGRADLKAIRGYSVIRELGRGGMGAVYLARYKATGVEVALKVMLPKVAASETARARFLREVALTRAMKLRTSSRCTTRASDTEPPQRPHGRPGSRLCPPHASAGVSETATRYGVRQDRVRRSQTSVM